MQHCCDHHFGWHCQGDHCPALIYVRARHRVLLRLRLPRVEQLQMKDWCCLCQLASAKQAVCYPAVGSAHSDVADYEAKAVCQMASLMSVVIAALVEALAGQRRVLTLWGYLLTLVSPHPHVCARKAPRGYHCYCVPRLVLHVHFQVKARRWKVLQRPRFHEQTAASDRFLELRLRSLVLAPLLALSWMV